MLMKCCSKFYKPVSALLLSTKLDHWSTQIGFSTGCIFFGDNVPKNVANVAMEVVKGCDALLVLGSSVTTMSGFRLVRVFLFLWPLWWFLTLCLSNRSHLSISGSLSIYDEYNNFWTCMKDLAFQDINTDVMLPHNLAQEHLIFKVRTS
ncbi:Sirtuin family [Artemisia annua]|uniref:Sirtuin family n=1 Tax=Artemisia annua TaxID=35608 RepID=A0A2U1PA04_ARTAN|nr:Sirtuin family [Artemisia annua]